MSPASEKVAIDVVEAAYDLEVPARDWFAGMRDGPRAEDVRRKPVELRRHDLGVGSGRPVAHRCRDRLRLRVQLHSLLSKRGGGHWGRHWFCGGS